jgi:hypothetical protein
MTPRQFPNDPFSEPTDPARRPGSGTERARVC